MYFRGGGAPRGSLLFSPGPRASCVCAGGRCSRQWAHNQAVIFGSRTAPAITSCTRIQTQRLIHAFSAAAGARQSLSGRGVCEPCLRQHKLFAVSHGIDFLCMPHPAAFTRFQRFKLLQATARALFFSALRWTCRFAGTKKGCRTAGRRATARQGREDLDETHAQDLPCSTPRLGS